MCLNLCLCWNAYMHACYTCTRCCVLKFPFTACGTITSYFIWLGKPCNLQGFDVKQRIKELLTILLHVHVCTFNGSQVYLGHGCLIFFFLLNHCQYLNILTRFNWTLMWYRLQYWINFLNTWIVYIIFQVVQYICLLPYFKATLSMSEVLGIKHFAILQVLLQ